MCQVIGAEMAFVNRRGNSRCCTVKTDCEYSGGQRGRTGKACPQKEGGSSSKTGRSEQRAVEIPGEEGSSQSLQLRQWSGGVNK